MRAARRADAVDRAGLRLLSLAGAARDTRLLASWASDAPQWVRAVGWYGDVSLVEPMLDRMGPSHGHRARTVARTLERLTGEPLLREGRTWEWLVQPRDFRAFWAERQSGYRESERLRFGKPYGAHASIAELERDGSTGDERDCCAFELAMVSAGRARFQPHDWVARQAEQAARARALLAETRSWHQSGEWLGDRLGKRG